jgi:hypothetical protein
MAKTRTSGQGRVKGVPNKLTASVKEMIEGALSDAGGKDYLLEQSKANPAAFMSLVGKLLPKDVNLSGNVEVSILTALMELPEK